MNERIVRTDVVTGQAEIIAMDVALSELSAAPGALYCELAPRLRGGECLRLPDGRAYSAAALMEMEATLPLPPNSVN